MHSRPQDRWKDGTTPAPLPHWIEKIIAQDTSNAKQSIDNVTTPVLETPVLDAEPARRSDRIAALAPPELPASFEADAEPVADLQPKGVDYWKSKCQELTDAAAAMQTWKARALQLSAD
jgi:hypothetical protein